MFHFNNHKVNKKEPLETALKASITINQLHNVPNPIRGRTSSNNDVPLKNKNTDSTTRIRAAGFAHKGKLIKCPLKSILLGAEVSNPKPEPKQTKSQAKYAKPKTSTLDFIEKLKEIEIKADKSDFLEQTNVEIDIAFKQLEEIKKMLIRKQQKVEEKKSCHQHSPIIKKQFEKNKKVNSNKTKIRYKSLRDLENIIERRCDSDNKIVESSDDNEPTEILFHKRKKVFNIKKNVSVTSNQNKTETSNCKSLQEKFALLKERLTQHQELFRSPKEQRRKKNVSFAVRFQRQELLRSPKEETRKKKTSQGVRFQNKTEYFSSSEEESPKINQVTSSRFKNFPKTTNQIKSSRFTNFSLPILDNEIEEDNIYQDGENVGDFNEQTPSPNRNNENCSPLGEWFREDIKLKQSISKSDYLSREFSIDFENKGFQVDKDKAGEKRSMQLFGTTRNKFRDQQSCQLANLTERDRKLCATLNIALKDTLFSEIH